MANIPPIQGAEEVLSALGWWPSFHDAEVIRFSLARGASPDTKTSDAELEVQVREYEPRNVGTAEYKVVLIKEVVIRFAFVGVEEVQVEDFNFQNVINSLVIYPVTQGVRERMRVEVESIYGFGATLFCNSAKVASVSRLIPIEA
ncbi:Imm50 family immunity protein [Undibacterium sp. RTI2.1]|uniref:Imm50 family immunity protein n=1 Tax=unclassified Undibacterium TaxID=2630295 RepID=UPI002AB4CB7A|nr:MULTISPECIES: Imm50 family immunity protein [unclassified Undibacterium]MDY7536811.1 Imm50 family immunity protein [Undibacterium sp. 5I1]MEB0029523.1 Imm50 family immunity protein [Undibacterium sp. RTI2.1]MEB0115710.1 Imm50 family immunity protein [Undibacterium sp. RTI2.2]MEB0231599.1 Imm50 family immunity protein [Undibacterium sp. 10I3]MEB0256693.1 Imm50 family immunity protein [Undibacterium sp. 5I1]